MERIKQYLKRPQVWGFFVAVAVMAVLSLAFFYPDNFEGNVLRQPDMQQGLANGQEAAAYEAATGEKALWTNSLFGGMPTFQISPSYASNSLFNWLNTVYGLGLPTPPLRDARTRENPTLRPALPLGRDNQHRT